MALVIVSGLPSSGRTTRCQELIADWQRRLDSQPSSSSSSGLPSRIVHLTDSTIHLPKSTYANQRDEKPARASYLSLVSRSLVKDAIVVADGGAGLNIKGFRYQLWCAAREVGMTCVSILVNSKPDRCRSWNSKRRNAGSEAYDDATIDDLFMRFEEPNSMTRWDSPLFILNTENFGENEVGQSSSSPSDLHSWEAPPYDAIWTAMTQGKVIKAPNVVIQNRTTSTNYLSHLEAASQALVAALLASLLSPLPPDLSTPLTLTPTLPSSTQPITIKLSLPEGERPPTAPQLQRLRRQFVKMHAAGFATGNLLGKTAKDEGQANQQHQQQSQQHQQKLSRPISAQSQSDLAPKTTFVRSSRIIPTTNTSTATAATSNSSPGHAGGNTTSSVPPSEAEDEAGAGAEAEARPSEGETQRALFSAAQQQGGTPSLDEAICRRFATWLEEILRVAT